MERNRRRRMWGLSLVTAALVMGMVSCATAIPISSVQAPTIDTQGIQRMAIKPFVDASGVGGPVAAQITQYLTTKAQQEITAAGKFTMVAPTDPNADGVFTGKITRILIQDSQESYQYRDGNVTRTGTRYLRKASLEFDYSVISTRTDMAIGTVMKSGSASDSSTASPSSLRDAATLCRQIVDAQARSLVNDVVPHIVKTNVNLMNETSKDKVVKQKMKAALAVVKAGNYEEAIRQYDEIAADHNSSAARTNAGFLRRSIESADAARAELSQLFQDKDGTAEKAMKNALGMLDTKLSSGSNITIMKQQSTERSMLDYVVDKMTETLIQGGKLKVMDRSNQALISAEQQFQLSGDVSDESMVSIGKQIGVKYIVLCWISGEKSLRRLNLKVLNVETSQITDQSAFEI